MDNEQTTTTTTTTDAAPAMDANAYVEQLANLKQTTVDKAEYERVVAENRTLANSLANGNFGKTTETAPTYDMDKLEKAYRDNYTLPQFLKPAKAALDLRDAILATEGVDVFAANAYNGKSQRPEDLQSAHDAAEVIRSCIKDCGGSDSTFFSLLCDRTEDDPTLLRAIAARNKKTRQDLVPSVP